MTRGTIIQAARRKKDIRQPVLAPRRLLYWSADGSGLEGYLDSLRRHTGADAFDVEPDDGRPGGWVVTLRGESPEGRRNASYRAAAWRLIDEWVRTHPPGDFSGWPADTDDAIASELGVAGKTLQRWRKPAEPGGPERLPGHGRGRPGTVEMPELVRKRYQELEAGRIADARARRQARNPK